ncbi:MAG: ATP-dependent helicase RecG [Pseudomonadota bacterium]|nr:ATP-dependent helicase RecG [Pseudomonadota bacterium]
MTTEERIRACYLHCCLKYVSYEPINNVSLRKRFSLGEENSASVSRVIAQTIKIGYVKLYDENANRRNWRYIPFWG